MKIYEKPLIAIAFFSTIDVLYSSDTETQTIWEEE